MHGDFQPLTRDRVEKPETEQPSNWPAVVLSFGGVLTLAWIGFLLWAVIEILTWMIS